MTDQAKIHQDEQIREMNAQFAAERGFTAEEAFDEREARYDLQREEGK